MAEKRPCGEGENTMRDGHPSVACSGHSDQEAVCMKIFRRAIFKSCLLKYVKFEKNTTEHTKIQTAANWCIRTNV